MNCNETMAALVASLENGTPMTEEQREHVRNCVRCRPLLDSAREMQSMLSEAPAAHALPDVTAEVEREVHSSRRRQLALRALAAIVIVALFGTLAAVVAADDSFTTGDKLAVFFGGIGIATLFSIPVVLFIVVAKGITRPKGRRPLYKRVGPGRVISGVALGIAEATKLNVSIVRLLFFLLILFDGVGILLYIVLALFMPVHPDDRQHLLRFRMRRAFRRA
ncbi:MAG TPA: PspC domain-containing protein [Thermoanaerobaculia bacterium]|jgi:phage shock protein PspC (stress-responsive transcriptional regulator)